MKMSETNEQPVLDTEPPGDPLLDLLHHHYAPIFRLAFSFLDSPEAARRTALRILTAAQPEAETWRTARGKIKLYATALREIQRLSQRTSLYQSLATQPAGFTASLWRMVDSWDVRERQLCVLYYVLGWPTDEAAKALGVGVGAAQAQLDIFRRRFATLPEQDPIEDLPAETFAAAEQLDDKLALLGDAAQQAAIKRYTPLEIRVARSLRQRWPAPPVGATEAQALLTEAHQLTQKSVSSFRLLSNRSVWLAGVAAALFFAFLAGGLAIFWIVEKRAGLQNAPPASVAEGLSTPFPPTPEVHPLTRRSSLEDIRRRWQESTSLWRSLTVDVQTIRYGPASYIGPPRAYRAQAWVLLPDQGIQLTGLLSQPIGKVDVVAGQRHFTRNYADNSTASELWNGEAHQLLPEGDLRLMLFPASSPWATRDGAIRSVENTQIAGRSAVALDWFNPEGQREARLWLDAYTGILLRVETYTGPDFQTLESVSLATEIAFDRQEPPPTLVIAARQRQTMASEVNPSLLGYLPTATPAHTSPPRKPLPADPAPAGMDVSRSRLIFQFPNDPAVSNAQINTASVPADLFADGYWLGSFKFGLPWMLRCQRSPDGRRLAFNTFSDGSATEDGVLRWLNLTEPAKVYQLLPEINVASFAFSPDSLRLAAAGSARSSQPDGLYVVEIATGEADFILEAHEAHSLVWSQDGEFIALIGRLPGETAPAMLVVHVRTHWLTFRGIPGQTSGAPPPTSSISSWGVTFPVKMGGMDECAAPPAR